MSQPPHPQQSRSRFAKPGQRVTRLGWSARFFRRQIAGTSSLLVAALFLGGGADATTVLDPLPENSTTLFGGAIATIGDINSDGVPDLAVGAPFQDGDFVETDKGFGKPQNVGKVFLLSGATLEVLVTLNDPEFQQTQPQKFGGQFGSVVAAAGDLNGDGIGDVLVGTPHHTLFSVDEVDDGRVNAGRVFAFSGKDGAILLTLDDPTPEESAKFGAAVVSMGDVNRDGVPDILVGVPGKDPNGRSNVGLAYGFSGADGSFIRTIFHPFQGSEEKEEGAAFGSAMANAGDLSHDGVPEVLISAPGGIGGGQVFIFNVKTGALIRTINSPVTEKEPSFGAAVAGGLDLDNDGTPDFVVGAPLQNHAQGLAYIFSGKDGALRGSLRNPVQQNGARFGAAVLVSADVTGDRRADVLVGAPDQSVGELLHTGEVFIFDGLRGRLLQSLTSVTPQAFAGFGMALATAKFSQSEIATPIIGVPLQDAAIEEPDGDVVTHLEIGQIEIK